MNPKEKIARLEGILARVRERADAPRLHGSGARNPGSASDSALRAAAPAVEPIRAAAAVEPSPIGPPVAPIRVAPVVTHARAPVPVDQNPTAPPPSMGSTAPPTTATPSVPPATSGWSEPPPTHVEAGPELDSDDVEVSSEIVEVDIDIDEPGMMMPAESGSQPVTDQVADSAIDGEAELDGMPTALVEEASLVPPPIDEPPPANEVQEPAPSSSPRAIASEKYGDESAPRHTPPPESGKQATAPSVRPEPSRKSAPPAVEGPTLIGGWRDPSAAQLASPPPARAPARVPPPPPPPPPPAHASAAPPPPPQAAAAPPLASPVRFTPDVMKPEFPSDAPVALVEGGAPDFAPATFGELLEASLGL